MKRLTLSAGPADEGERIDRFIAARGGISRGEARRVLERGGVFLDGKRCKVAGRTVRRGSQVTVNLEEAGRGADAPPPLDRSRLLYADEAIAIVDKPAGVPAQATLTSDRGHLPELVSALLGTPVRLVHRLDRETSGVTVLARTAEAERTLAAAFRDGGPEKTYLALCARAPAPPEGRIDAPLGKDPSRPGRRAVLASGDPAATRYRTLAIGPGGAALVEARPETGRTHQIRVHLAALGAPLLGDSRYGGPRMVGPLPVPRVMLHALRLEIDHPATGARTTFEAPVPADLAAVRDALVGAP
ncbi:MAG TPA: RluA family pseudouridine synthase [Anaeromyxobacteraceae bacterium]|nr:RluA family pseudouridine synthase [Anaeromyxobacteraceae bacterium]